MSMCQMCAAGMPSSCLTGSCESMDTQGITESIPQEIPSLTFLSQVIGSTGNVRRQDLQEDGNRSSDDSRIADSNRRNSRSGGSGSQSAGRKVAAKQYPLDENADCEWRGKANCGGGDWPILGCLDGKQQARHHGPEKNVQNNEQGNVHRICHYCHYRWHAKNDPTYDWNAGVWPPHNPRPLTDKEQREVAVDVLRYMSTKRSTKIKELD